MSKISSAINEQMLFSIVHYISVKPLLYVCARILFSSCSVDLIVFRVKE